MLGTFLEGRETTLIRITGPELNRSIGQLQACYAHRPGSHVKYGVPQNLDIWGHRTIDRSEVPIREFLFNEAKPIREQTHESF